MTTNHSAEAAPVSTEELDLVWGGENIARVIKKSRSSTFAMLDANELPARKVGNRWVASRRRLREFFEGVAA